MRDRGQCGFTTVELLLATTLFALLAGATLFVIGHLRPRTGRPQRPVEPAWVKVLWGHLEADLTHALAWRRESRGISLLCHRIFDRDSGSFKEEPSLIRYEVDDVEGVRLLLRSSEPLTSGSSPRRQPQTEILVAGLQGFRVEPGMGREVEELERSQVVELVLGKAAKDDEFRTVPTFLTARLELDESRVWSEVLVLE